MQSEWAGIYDNMNAGYQNSPYGQKLSEVAGLDLQSALDAITEAAAADLPRGYGRD
jgi:hypothetical protein